MGMPRTAMEGPTFPSYISLPSGYSTVPFTTSFYNSPVKVSKMFSALHEVP